MITSSHTGISKVIQDYEKALQATSVNSNSEAQKNLEMATAEMDHKNAWDYERRLKQLLKPFQDNRYHQKNRYFIRRRKETIWHLPLFYLMNLTC